MFTGFAAYGKIDVTMYPPEYYYNTFWGTIFILGGILVGLFVLFGYLQALFLVITDYKKIGAKKRRELASAVLLFPFFLMLYSVTISIGAMSKPKWGKVERNAPPPTAAD